MPTPDVLLAQLALMTERLAAVAVLWHVVVAALLVALLAGWRPSRRAAVAFLAVPAASVAGAAAAYGNPFNAIAFGALAVALGVLAKRRSDAPVEPAPLALFVVGAGVVAFGWAYPHFVVGHWARVLYAAPMGVIPCPTLALLAGLTVLGRGFGSRAVPWILAAWTAFYAAFGVGRLGVSIDLGLALACAALVVTALRRQAFGASSRATAYRPSMIGA